MEKKTFSPERLYKIRRLRKARRLYKQTPLFAYQLMLADYNQYQYEEFLDDLRRRTLRKPKNKKTNMVKYGRYNRMFKLIFEYKYSKDINLLIQAQKLKDHMSKPYRVRFETNSEELVCTFPATLDITRIEELVRNSKMYKTLDEVEELVKKFRNSYGQIK